MRVLVVEDDSRAARHLTRGLTESGHVVDHAADGETGLALAGEGTYDVIIVDRRLPALDGLTLVRRLREQNIVTPVLMLSAIASSADRVEGMRAGCDDYLAKPYAFIEVLARLEALVRRDGRGRGANRLRGAGLEAGTQARKGGRGGGGVPLQHRAVLRLRYRRRGAGGGVS